MRIWWWDGEFYDEIVWDFIIFKMNVLSKKFIIWDRKIFYILVEYIKYIEEENL